MALDPNDSAAYSDRLAALGRIGRGLQARIFYLQKVLSSPGSRLSALHDQEFDRIRRKLERSFPKLDDLKAEKGFERFQTEANKVCEELSDIYSTLNNVREFKERAIEALSLAPSILGDAPPSFDHCPHLLSGILDVLVRFVQLPLQLTKMGERKLITGLYASAFQCMEGCEDPSYLSLAQFLIDFENPVRHAQDELAKCSGLATTVSTVLDSLATSYQLSINVSVLTARNTLNPVADGTHLHETVDPKPYHDLRIAERANTWIIYGYLACPDGLVKPNSMALLKMAMEQSFVVPVFRDQVLDFHNEFYELFGWFPPKASQIKFEKGVKPRSVMAEAAAEATNNAGKMHRERRAFLTSSLEALLKLLTDCPGLAAPKAPIVLAALAMARAETVWHFQHLPEHAPPPTIHSGVFGFGGPKAVYDANSFRDQYIALLVNLQLRVGAVLRKHWTLIAKYNLEYLSGADLITVSKLAQESQGRLSAQRSRDLLSEIVSIMGSLPKISGAELPPPSTPSFGNAAYNLPRLRAIWRRLECAIAARGASVAIGGLCKRMSFVVERSLVVGDNAEILTRLLARIPSFEKRTSFIQMTQNANRSLLTGGPRLAQRTLLLSTQRRRRVRGCLDGNAGPVSVAILAPSRVDSGSVPNLDDNGHHEFFVKSQDTPLPRLCASFAPRNGQRTPILSRGAIHDR